MSDSLEDTVASAVVESLQAIAPTAGYHTDQPLPHVQVSCDVVPPDHVAIAVDLQAIGSGRGDSVRRALDFVEDIRRRLLVEDPTLGGRVLGVEERDTDEADGALSRNDGSAHLNFEAQAKPAEANDKEQS